MSLFSLSFSIVLEVPAHAKEQEKKAKYLSVGKKKLFR